MTLPAGWALASIGEVVEGRVDQRAPGNSLVSYIDIRSIDREAKRVTVTKQVNSATAPTRARQWVRRGDVLVSMTRPNLNAVALVTPELDGAVASTGFDVLRAIHSLPEWVFYRVRTHAFVHDVCEDVQGVVYPAIRPDDVRRHTLPIAPLDEQRRIVDAVESYLSRLDAAVASLDRAQAKLKAYRASMLAAAVGGRLVPTEAEMARAEKRDYEPADVLLKRILADRRRRWEKNQLANFKRLGTPLRDDKWKAKYQEPVGPDTTGLLRLPEGWCWARLGQLADVTGGLTKNSARDSLATKLPYLRVANVYANCLLLDQIKEIGVDDCELPRLLLESGDLLVVEGNGSVDQIGRVALWDGSISPIVHQNHLIKARFVSPPTERWALTWLLSPSGRSAIEQVASSTSGLHTLSISKVENLPVPLPPTHEQERILQSTEEASSILEVSTIAVARDRQRSDRLRQAVLKWAFEGRLVDQDSSDEPAEKLLQRIRAERVSSASVKTPRRSRTKAAR